MAEWFRHDVHCLQDDRLFALVSRYGAEGYAVFFHTVETMYANNGDPISDITMRRIAFELSMPFDKVSGIIEFASSESCGNLFESRPEGYVSDRVLREIEYQESQRMRYSNMGKASAERRLRDKSNVGSTQVEHKLNAGSTHNITRQDKTKQINISDSSKDSSLGEHCECPPVEEAGKTDLFGQKIEEERERVPVQKVVDYWNKAVKDTPLPQIRQPNESRKTLIRQRWAEYKNDVYEAIDRTVSSDFLTGRDGKWSRCCFDWVFKKENMTKILEGNYDNKKEEAVRRHKDYSDIKDEDLEEEFHWT